jgi:type IV pilus biogenesis protein CpaD/CtpE
MRNLALAAIAALILSACTADRCTDRVMAYVMSQHFVERQLRSPSTARFPAMSSQGVSVTQAGECRFNVASYVDAQNGFGATIRQRYMVVIEYEPERGTWRLVELAM